LQFLRERRAAVLGVGATKVSAERTKVRELNLVHAADHVVVISEVEAEILRKVERPEKVSVCSILRVPGEKSPEPFASRKDVCFLGGFGHNPNVDAVNWFVDEIWPRILVRRSEVRFLIVGAEMPDSVRALGMRPGVEVVGFVEDVEVFLSSCRVGVVPLRFGAGIKGKLAMMLGVGLPTVSTSVGVEGMNLVRGQDIIVSDSPDEFAAEVVRLYVDEDSWFRMSEAGRDAVVARYGVLARETAVRSMLINAKLL
jgi:glycosyltransferase involved in cell wall biosynthesis